MLGPEDIDDDYFTPLPNTSLKNIFGSISEETRTDGDPLKYSAPKAESVNTERAVDRAPDCLFACALVAHEWSENVYKSRGKLGYAIIKTSKNTHVIILYDSNKTTLSSTTITPNLKVFLKGALHLSFYDNNQTYWNLMGKANEISEIVNILEKFDIQVVSDSPVSPMIERNDQEPKNVYAAIPCDSVTDQQDSDTDSATNKKTKAAILNRMANMGQSVLPRHTTSEAGKKKDSDSSSSDNDLLLSDTDKIRTNNTIARLHGGPKSVKRTNAYKEVSEITKIVQPTSLYPVYGGQIVHNASSSNGSELNHFISEQRISNTELRININKTSDKVDQVVDILKNLSVQGNVNNSDFQTEIMKKLISEYESKIQIYEEKLQKQPLFDNVDSNLTQLLKEYETKIKLYEEKLQSAGAEHMKIRNEYETRIKILEKELRMVKDNNVGSSRDEMRNPNPSTCSEYDLTDKDINIQFKDNIKDLEERVIDKNNIINELHRQMKEIERQALERQTKYETDFTAEITKLSKIIALKDMQLAANAKTYEDQIADTTDFQSKLKKVMNETFQLISVNFENGKHYLGDNVKAIIAAVIKKSTNNIITNQPKN